MLIFGVVAQVAQVEAEVSVFHGASQQGFFGPRTQEVGEEGEEGVFHLARLEQPLRRILDGDTLFVYPHVIGLQRH